MECNPEASGGRLCLHTEKPMTMKPTQRKANLRNGENQYFGDIIWSLGSS